MNVSHSSMSFLLKLLLSGQILLQMDLEPRINADPLFAFCYYADSHQGYFKHGSSKDMSVAHLPAPESRTSIQLKDYWVSNGQQDEAEASPFDGHDAE